MEESIGSPVTTLLITSFKSIVSLFILFGPSSQSQSCTMEETLRLVIGIIGTYCIVSRALGLMLRSNVKLSRLCAVLFIPFIEDGDPQSNAALHAIVVLPFAANAASLLLYSAPILTFGRVVRKRSTEEFSCIPYTVALLNCLLAAWYALPIVSIGWENLAIITISGIGIHLQISFIVLYICFTTPRQKIKVAVTVTSFIIIFAITAIISALVLHDHQSRKQFVGSVMLIVSVAMYSSPLVILKQVMETKSVEYMPLHFSVFSFLASTLWMVYGLLSHDLFIAGPSFLASPLGILQLVLYFKYRNCDIKAEPSAWDIEKNEENVKQLQLTCPNNTNVMNSP